MIKNAIIFKIVGDAGTVALGDALEENRFTPCGATQEVSIGWVPPRGEDHGALLESIAGHHILRMMTETKKVPSDVPKRAVDENVKGIEASTGRKPGKKERSEIADEIRLTMLPAAFPTRAATLVWVDPAAGYAVIEASSTAKTDAVLTLLVKTFDKLALKLVQTTMSPASAMSAWLATDTLGSEFSIDRECELRASDEGKAKVRYSNHALDIEEIRQHIVVQGKIPVMLSMTWNDRVSFGLTDTGAVKKLSFLESVFEGAGKDSNDDAFDADVAIMTGELSQMIPALINELGGEIRSD